MHGQVVGFSFVNWDDDLHVVRNASVVEPHQVPMKDHLLTPYLGYPVPVTVGSYVMDHFVAGLNSAWFHAVNLIIHLAVSVLLFLLAMHLGCRPWLAVACALLFALHPATGEPVAWVSGRKDLLAALFSLLALSSYLGIHESNRGVRARLPVAGLALLAVLSKPSALLLPLLFMALDIFRGKSAVTDVAQRRDNWLWGRSPGLMVWAALIGFNTGLAVIAYKLETGMGALEGAVGNMLTRVLAGAGWHARIIAWPFDLMPKYLDPIDGPSMVTLVVGGVVVVGFLALTVWTFIKRHPAFVGLALALLCYVPQSGLMPLSRQYANSYVYPMLAGLVLALGAALVPVFARAKMPVRVIAAAAALILLAGMGVASSTQDQVYRDGVALWSNVYAEYPDSPQVCRNLGNAFMYRDRNEPDKAAATYEHCIKTLGNRQFFLKNLAVARYRGGHRLEARRLFIEMQEFRPGDPVAQKYLRLLSE